MYIAIVPSLIPCIVSEAVLQEHIGAWQMVMKAQLSGALLVGCRGSDSLTLSSDSLVDQPSSARVAASCHEELYEDVAMKARRPKSLAIDIFACVTFIPAMVTSGAPLCPAFSRSHGVHFALLADWQMHGACGEMPGSRF
jgi:hypothetical protein